MMPVDMWYIVSILIVLHQHVLLTIQECQTCPEETESHGESCYYFSSSEASRNVANKRCTKRGFHLAYIQTEEEQEFIEGRMVEEDFTDCWIGLTIDSNGDGVWMDGSSLTYDHTDDESYNEGLECLRIRESAGYRWHDRSCSTTYPYVCEKENECSETTVPTTEMMTTTPPTTTTQSTTTKPTTTTVTTTTQSTTASTTTQPTTTKLTTTTASTTQPTTTATTTQPTTKATTPPTTTATTTQPTTTKPTTTKATTTQSTTTKVTTQQSTTTVVTTTETPKAHQRSNRYKSVAKDYAVKNSAVVERYSASSLIRCSARCSSTESCSHFTFIAENQICLLGRFTLKSEIGFEKLTGAITFEAILS